MNHLAHARIAVEARGSIVGNLMGDFVKGRPEDQYEGVLLEGILLHRRVDVFTDDHEIFARSRRRIRPPHRRYSGILVDIFYDHFLARHWSEYSTVSLREFTDHVYSELETGRESFPPRMRRFVRYAVDTDLLVAYRETAGIARALAGLSTRLSRPNPLAHGVEALEAEYVGLEGDFLAYFPELLAAFGDGDPGRRRGSGAPRAQGGC